MSRRRPGSHLRISPASKKQKPNSRRSLISLRTRRITAGSGPGYQRASCLSGHLAPERRSWHAPSRARRVSPSSQSRAPSSWRCSSASVRPVFATSSSRHARQSCASSLSMSWTAWGAFVQRVLRKIKPAPNLDVDQIAAITPGFSGADLANLVNEAALTATRRHGTDVTMDDFTKAVERLVAGIEKRSRLLNPEERRIVAYHEMGHALVASALRFLISRTDLENRTAVLMGGRAA